MRPLIHRKVGRGSNRGSRIPWDGRVTRWERKPDFSVSASDGLRYELRLADSSETTLGEANSIGFFEEFGAVAELFATCGALFKQIVALKGDEPRFLNAAEEAQLDRVLAAHGLEAVAVDGGER